MSTDTDKAKEFFDEPAVECKWIKEEDSEDNINSTAYYSTSCKSLFELSNNLTLKENNMKYCCFCGGKIL